MTTEFRNSRGKWIACGPLMKLLQWNSCGSNLGGMSKTAVLSFSPIVIIHSSGTTITAQMNSATTYHAVVPIARGLFFAGRATSDTAGREASVVVTVGPERGELRGQGDDGNDDDEQHPHLRGRVSQLRDP